MPSRTTYDVRTVNDRISFKGTTNSSKYTQFNMLTESVAFPKTVKRPRPNDFFIWTTAREVSGSKFSGSATVHLNSGYPGMVWDRTGENLWRIFSSLGPSGLTSGLNREILYNKIRSKARGDATNLAQAMAEYRQTASLFNSLSKDLFRITRAVLTRRPSLLYVPRKDWSKKISSEWLRYVYGVEPLLSDMHSAIQDLHQKSITKLCVVNGKVSHRDTVSMSITRPGSYSAGASNGLPWVADVAFDLLTIEKTKYRIELNQNALSNTLVRHGFANPFAVAWELVPFSFVADWWVNTGEVLSSLDNLLLVDRIRIADSTFSKTTCKIGSRAGQYTGNAYAERTVSTRKDADQISGIASLVYKPSPSIRHIANGTALIRTLMSGKRK